VPTDTSEKGLESLIVASLCDEAGYVAGDSSAYDREHAVDLAKLLSFLEATQPEIVEKLNLAEEDLGRQQFLHRLQGEIAKRGVIEVFRNGVKHGSASVDLFYGTPSPDNPKAVERFAANIFSVTRQLRFSKDETQLALDLCLFINGLPIATFELKNSLTKQTADDAVQQYMRDRDPRELLFQFSRCVVHFAVDDHEVRFSTELKDSTTAQEIRLILRVSRPITYGKKLSRSKGSRTSWRITPRWWKRRTKRDGRNTSRYSPATTSLG
jgi:type I restriction enzyme R subunit